MATGQLKQSEVKASSASARLATLHAQQGLGDLVASANEQSRPSSKTNNPALLPTTLQPEHSDQVHGLPTDNVQKALTAKAMDHDQEQGNQQVPTAVPSQPEWQVLLSLVLVDRG
jgi:hypothetical protein